MENTINGKRSNYGLCSEQINCANKGILQNLQSSSSYESEITVLTFSILEHTRQWNLVNVSR